jgi:hypothetical protein
MIQRFDQVFTQSDVGKISTTVATTSGEYAQARVEDLDGPKMKNKIFV